VPEHRRVTAFAAYRMAFNAGWAFGPAAAAFLASHSFLWLFVGDAVTSAMFGVVALLLLPPTVKSAQAEAGWTEAFTLIRRDGRIHQVALATIFIGFVFHQLVSSYGLHVTSLGFSDAVYGTLLSLNGVLVVICELPITAWTRRFAPRAMMACGYLLMGTGLMLNVVAHSVAALAFGMAVFTFGEMMYAPVASAYVASIAPPRMRGRFIGTWALANSLSLMFAPSLGMAIFARNASALWIGCGVMAAFAALTISLKPRDMSAVAAQPARLIS
jgi:MFS family permease